MINWTPVGDTLFIMNEPEGEISPSQAASIAQWILNQKIIGVQEVIPVFNSIGIYVDPLFDPQLLPKNLPSLSASDFSPRLVEVEMRFDPGFGDCDEICQLLGISQKELIERFLASEFTVGAIGFCPGFPYLLGLDQKLQGIKRKETPRKQVPAGSIAIVEDQACIYTMDRPGGWWLIGQTSDRLVEIEKGFFAFSTGDQVRFTLT